MRRLLLLLALLAFGCDDPAVSAKVADVLEHGFVLAALKCEVPDYGGNNHYSLGFRAHKLIDGSCIVDGSPGFFSRSDPEAATCPAGQSNIWAVDGEYLYAGPDYDPSAPYQLDMETYCTGFNFEAFGGE